MPIVAMNAGNAVGAKGYRFGITNRGDMPRHRADSAHDHRTCSLHAMGEDGTAKKHTSLMGILCDPAGLRGSFEAQPGNKAAGVDRVRKADDAEGIDARLAALSIGLRRLGK